eukprot:5819583-Heterocapsa_arctica.AAC.1
MRAGGKTRQEGGSGARRGGGRGTGKEVRKKQERVESKAIQIKERLGGFGLKKEGKEPRRSSTAELEGTEVELEHSG